MSETTFTFKTDESKNYAEAIKWSRGTSRYEVYVPTLSTLELNDLLPHCMAVRAKGLSTVGTDAHKGPSLYEVFPRSLSLSSSRLCGSRSTPMRIMMPRLTTPKRWITSMLAYASSFKCMQLPMIGMNWRSISALVASLGTSPSQTP